MSRVSILDCTLRDGGYVNSFKFGAEEIRGIASRLGDAGIDIIETGFLRSGCTDPDKTLFGSVEAALAAAGVRRPGVMYVGMIQYGAISANEISPRGDATVDGIRVTFHAHEIDSALELCRELMEKGYEVFVQPVGTTSYTDRELLELVERVNGLRPYAFYLVDTLGKLYPKDVLRMAYLVDNNLLSGIALGFHSHNNLQMSFADAQRLVEAGLARDLILDASVFGMGRGAGNLCTELIAHYLNAHCGSAYVVDAILEVHDEYIAPLSRTYSWGYSAAYCMAAFNDCHPNYATYLLDRQTLRARDISDILSSMPEGHGVLYDESSAESMYHDFMSRDSEGAADEGRVADVIAGRDVLLLAPGQSLATGHDEIIAVARKGLAVVSVNFVPDWIEPDVVFVSNLKRFDRFEQVLRSAPGSSLVVVTSNVRTDADVARVGYAGLLNDDSLVADNAGLMCLRLLERIGVTSVVLAGFDGFAKDGGGNYYAASMEVSTDGSRQAELNDRMAKKLADISHEMVLSFLTESRYG